MITVTLTTVGYGDQEPWKSHASMFFAACYALTGIMLMGTALGIIASHLLEQRDKAMEEARRNGEAKKKAKEEIHKTF